MDMRDVQARQAHPDMNVPTSRMHSVHRASIMPAADAAPFGNRNDMVTSEFVFAVIEEGARAVCGRRNELRMDRSVGRSTAGPPVAPGAGAAARG
jgi:hypothetical protein